MIRPLRFLWRQLNGPQITGIMVPIFRWLQEMFNDNIDYLRHFSLHTSNEEHLTLIGACFGIIRPIVVIPSSEFFLFTRTEEHDSTHGLSDTRDLSVGGRLSDLEEDLRQKQAILCPAKWYRQVLLANADNPEALYSTIGILNVCIYFWNMMHPNELCPVRIHWYEDGDDPFGITRTHGDVEILLGAQRGWGDDDTTVQIQGVLQSIFRELLYPQLIVDVNYDDVMSVSVSIDPNGGEGEPRLITQILTGQQLEVPENPYSFSYHTFAGWSLDPEAVIPEYLPGSTITINDTTVLYAIWTGTVPIILRDTTGIDHSIRNPLRIAGTKVDVPIILNNDGTDVGIIPPDYS